MDPHGGRWPPLEVWRAHHHRAPPTLVLSVGRDLEYLWAGIGREDPGYDPRGPRAEMRLVLPLACVMDAQRELVEVGRQRKPTTLNKTTLLYIDPIEQSRQHEVSWLSFAPSALSGTGHDFGAWRYWTVSQYLVNRHTPDWMNPDELERAEAAAQRCVESERQEAEQRARIERIQAETEAAEAEHEESMRRMQAKVAALTKRLDQDE